MEIKSNRVLLLLSIGVLMAGLDLTIVGPALPIIKKIFDVEQQMISWTFLMYILTYLISITFFAKLSDIYGRKKIFMLCVILFALGSFIISICWNFKILLIGRAIQGFGASGVFPVSAAIIADIFPVEKRGRALGSIGAALGLSFIIGPLIAGILLKFFSWQTLFLVNLPIALILIIGCFLVLPNKNKVNDKVKIDWGGILLLGLFLGTFIYSINAINFQNIKDSLLDYKVYPFFIMLLFLFIGFIFFESKSKNPIINLKIFKSKQISLVSIIAICTGIFQACFVFIPDFAVFTFGVDSSKSSFMLIPSVLALAIGSTISGKMLDKMSSKIVVITGTAFALLGCLLIYLLASHLFWFYLASILIGLGLSFLGGPSLRYIYLHEVPEEERASTQGLLNIFLTLGQLLGTTLIGLVSASGGSNTINYPIAFFYISIILSGVVLLGLFLKKNETYNTSKA
jgi:EmrB/QacA subfamily drug resistance transporter